MGYLLSMDNLTQTRTIAIRPKISVLGHKVLTLGTLALAGFAFYVLLRWREGDSRYFVETFPVHLLLAGLIGIYLIYLTYALYHTLSTTRKIICDASGLEIHFRECVVRYAWAKIEHVRLGDLYLKLDTVGGRVELPFLSREDQRIIYRFYNERVRFMPDKGRFLAPLSRR